MQIRCPHRQVAIELVDGAAGGDPPPLLKLNSQVPADLDTLCLKCLEKDPSRRFPTAAALAQELHRFLHGEPIHSRPITQWERARKWCQRNPAVASLSAAVVIVLLEVREMQSTLRGLSPFDLRIAQRTRSD